jgi:hypothetical protein
MRNPVRFPAKNVPGLASRRSGVHPRQLSAFLRFSLGSGVPETSSPTSAISYIITADFTYVLWSGDRKGIEQETKT